MPLGMHGSIGLNRGEEVVLGPKVEGHTEQQQGHAQHGAVPERQAHAQSLKHGRSCLSREATFPQRRSCPLGYLPSQGSIRHLLCHEHHSFLHSYLRSHTFMLCPTLLKPSTALLNSDENCMRSFSWSRHEKFLISFQYAFHQPLLPSSMQGGRFGITSR